MATIEDVARLTGALPEVTEGERFGSVTWYVAGKAFAWIRPFSKADLRRFGDDPVPDGPILAVRTADLHEKEAILAANGSVFFTIPHFDGFAAVLIELPEIAEPALREALLDAWRAVAPARIAAQTPEGFA